MEDSLTELNARIRKTMMGLLARREHSRLELLQKLQLRGFDSALINSNLDDFTANDWQSDSRYAEMLMRSRIVKNHGPVKISLELKQKGISAVLIQQCLEQEIDWSSLATKALTKKFADRTIRQNENIIQYRFLQQRGFSSEQIKIALQNYKSKIADNC